MSEAISRDQYFMQLAELTSKRSKDPSTKVGACIVKDNHVLSLGYNGAPRNFPDELVPKTHNQDSPLCEQKNAYMVHAEQNAVLNFRGDLGDLAGSTIYVTHSPCNECAKTLCQVGVKKIIYEHEYHRTDIWNTSKIILDNCGVEYEEYITDETKD